MQKLKRVQEICLVVILLLIIGCGKETVMDEYVDIDTNPETNESPEMTNPSATDADILQKYLNLPPTPFNYANLPLPSHFTDGELTPIDNMPDDNLTTAAISGR